MALITLLFCISKHTHESNFYFANFRFKIYIRKFLSKLKQHLKLKPGNEERELTQNSYLYYQLGEADFWSRDVSRHYDKENLP